MVRININKEDLHRHPGLQQHGKITVHCTNLALVSRRKFTLALEMRSMSLLNNAPPPRMLLFFITKQHCSVLTRSFFNYRHPVPNIVTPYICLNSIIITLEICFTATHTLPQYLVSFSDPPYTHTHRISPPQFFCACVSTGDWSECIWLAM